MKKLLNIVILAVACAAVAPVAAAAPKKDAAIPTHCYVAKQVLKIAVTAPCVYAAFKTLDQYPGKDPQSETIKHFLKALLVGVFFKSFDDSAKALAAYVDGKLDEAIAPVAHTVCGVNA